MNFWDTTLAWDNRGDWSCNQTLSQCKTRRHKSLRCARWKRVQLCLCAHSRDRHDIHDVVSLKSGPIVNATTLEIIHPADHRRGASRGQRRDHRAYGQGSGSRVGGGSGRSSLRRRSLSSGGVRGSRLRRSRVCCGRIRGSCVCSSSARHGNRRCPLQLLYTLNGAPHLRLRAASGACR